MNSVTDAPPVVRKGAFCKQNVRHEHEALRNCTAHEVCHREWVSDLRGLVDLGYNVDHGGEDDRPISLLTCWVEENNTKDLE